MKSKVVGGCHCGAVRFEANVQHAPELLDCNCSICTRTGFLHLIVQHLDFTLLKGVDDLTHYAFGSGQADHLFCSHCGVKSFYQPRSHPDSWSVNYNCLDTGHGLTPMITKFDGQNWEAAKAGLKSKIHRRKSLKNGPLNCSSGPFLREFRRSYARSKRSAFMTLVHAATKSVTNFRSWPFSA